MSQGYFPKERTIIASDSIVNDILEEKLSRKDRIVKVFSFPGASIEDMSHHIIPNFSKKLSNITLVNMIFYVNKLYMFFS